MVDQTSRSVDILRLSALVRWRPVLFPLEQSKLLRLLPERGYVVSESVLNQRQPYGSRVEATGVVARKGSMALVLDTDRPGMGLEGLDIVETLNEFDEIEQLFLESLSFDSNGQARFYELDLQVLVESRGIALDQIRQLAEGNNFHERIEASLGHPISRSGFRLCSPTGSPLDENWYEIHFDASLRSSNNYFALLTFRNPERSIVWDLAHRATELLQTIAENIEAG